VPLASRRRFGGQALQIPAAVDHHDALERGARLGYAARALVYLIIGGFAFLAAIGQGGGTTDSQGALRVLLGQPFGKVLLAGVALGLLGYAIWRLLMGIRDPEGEGRDGKGLARRAGYIASGLVNLALALAAGSLVLPGVIPAAGNGGGNGGGGNGGDAKDWTAWLLSQPFGQWLVGAVGLIVIGVGVAFAVRAYKASFERELDPEACTPVIRSICRIGILARAVVFAMIGIFLLIAAWQADPSEAKGLGAALQSLRAQPYGPILLGAVGLGLVAFAFYSLVAARYRRIRTR
jgi:Domain of Unknown Function (DUF1206)